MPDKLILPRQLVFEAERILKSTLQNDTANNAINALRSRGTIPEYHVCHYFTDSNNWFIRTNAPNGMCWFDRASVEFKRDTDFDTDNANRLYTVPTDASTGYEPMSADTANPDLDVFDIKWARNSAAKWDYVFCRQLP